MSSVIGLVLILAAGFGCCYFAYSLIQDIRQRKKKPPTDKK